MRTYCERCGPGLFDEPINVISNLVFIIAALVILRLAIKNRVLTIGLKLLIGLSVAVGLGSMLWHMYATPWAMILDIVPIILFQITFLWLYGRHVVRLAPVWVGMLVTVYLGAGFWLTEYKEWLNGSLVYLPAVVLSWVVGIHYWISSRYVSVRRMPYALLVSAAVFCVALTFRSLDLVLCRRLPIGTHFLWHLFNGIVVYLTMRVIVAVWGEQHTNKCLLER